MEIGKRDFNGMLIRLERYCNKLLEKNIVAIGKGTWKIICLFGHDNPSVRYKQHPEC
jgi:hypothetical protein